MDLTRWIICGYNVTTLQNVEFPIIARQGEVFGRSRNAEVYPLGKQQQPKRKEAVPFPPS